MPARDKADRKPHKFDPKKTGRLDSPERRKILPEERVLELLELGGEETVVDYGAGSGVLTVPVSESVPAGLVYAVDESREMLRHLGRGWPRRTRATSTRGS